MTHESRQPAPDRIVAALCERIRRPLTEAEEAAAVRWARGESLTLMLADHAFGPKERERLSR